MNIKTPSNHLLLLFVLLLTGMTFLDSCAKKDNTKPVESGEPPIISSFTPNSGVNGTTITIIGVNFSTSATDNKVTFNGITATVTKATASSITVKVPSGAGTGKIAIRVGAHADSSSTDFMYRYTVSTLAGDGTEAFADGKGPTAHFFLPFGVKSDALGNVYAADFGNDRIRKITPAGDVSTIAGSVAGTSDRFYNPSGVAIDASGNLYVADSYNHQIRKITPGGSVSVLAGAGSGNPGFADGQDTAARFKFPSGIAIDATGLVYVADQENNRIRKITAHGLVSTIAGNGNFGFANGSGTTSEFKFPTGIALDASGNLYVADSRNNRIRKIDRTGLVTTVAGDGNAAFKDGPGSVAQFNNPAGLAVDAKGYIYVADALNHRIRKISPAGDVSTIAGGDFGFADGIDTTARFYFPTGITIDPFGNIYVADSANNRIRKLQ